VPEFKNSGDRSGGCFSLVWLRIGLTQTVREGVLEFSKALSGADVRPNRVQPLINSRKGKAGKREHLVRSMRYSKKKTTKKPEKNNKK